MKRDGEHLAPCAAAIAHILEEHMKSSWRLLTTFALAAGLCALCSSGARAQSHSGTSSNTNPNSNPGGPGNSPSNPENLLELVKPPVPGEEKAFKAFKSFQAIPNSDAAKKIQSGESFIQKFPTSDYRSYVYGTLTINYFSTNQPDKAITAGEKSLELNPSDIYTMGVLSQALARLYNPSQPDAARLDKAEQYGKKAVELAPTLKKPDTASQEVFDANKGAALAMAHSGLGLVAIRRGNAAAAIQELDLATKLDNDRDPANLYLLGFANEGAGHFTEAATAFHRCAAVGGNMQDTCKKAESEAQKHATVVVK